jgi:hypothetical protein
MSLIVVAHFLVDDALHILSALSRTHSSSESTSSSIFLRFLLRALDILKSVSFLQYSSQEEPLTAHSEKHDTLEQAMSLLTKAAEMHNSDALYLLGELNFVPPFLDHIDCSMATIRKQIIASLSNGSRN